MKTQINKEEHLQLIGVIAIGEQLKKRLDDVEGTIAHIIGEEQSEYGGYDWSGEFIWTNRGIGELLKILKIEVKDD